MTLLILPEVQVGVVVPIEADRWSLDAGDVPRLAGVGGRDGRRGAHGGGDVSGQRLLGVHLPAVFPERRETVAGECLGCLTQFAIDARLPLPATCPDCGDNVRPPSTAGAVHDALATGFPRPSDAAAIHRRPPRQGAGEDRMQEGALQDPGGAREAGEIHRRAHGGWRVVFDLTGNGQMRPNGESLIGSATDLSNPSVAATSRRWRWQWRSASSACL